MEGLILIPLSLLALLLWSAFGVSSLRRRVRLLEEETQLLRSRLARTESTIEARSLVSPAESSATAPLPRKAVPPAPPSPPLATGASLAPPASLPPALPPRVPTAVPPGATTAVTSEASASAPAPATTGGVPGSGASPTADARIPGLPPLPPRPLAPPKAPAEQFLAGLNWEQFMGVKLFAWVGGFALFLAVAFFVKYSFDQGWISPALRVTCGFATGLGLLTGGVLLKRREYAVTAHALCATGVVILYAASFAARRPYELIGDATAFALMVLVTVTAFLLAVRLPALVVAVLGLLGGFLTPPLLSTGVDNPLGLFGYIVILDAGLVAVALKRRWHFLVALAAAGTVLMQLGWTAEFFTAGKVMTALAVFATFNALFLAAALLAERSGQANPWTAGPALALPFVTFAFTLWLLGNAEVAARPGVLLAFLVVAELPLAALALQQPRWAPSQPLAGAAAFLVLAAWTTGRLTPELLNWALGAYLGFAAFHTLFPVFLNRTRPGTVPVWVGHLFPPLALVLVAVPMLRELTVPWLVWPVVLLVDMLAIGLALVTGAVLGVLAMVALTVAVAAVWLFAVPADVAALPELLLVAGGFAVFFFAVGLGFGERILARLEAMGGAERTAVGGGWLDLVNGRAPALALIPAASGMLPFLLLVMAVDRLPLVNPTPVFGLALLLAGLLLVLAWRFRLDGLPLVALGCVGMLEWVWHGTRFTSGAAAITVTWNVGFALLFLAFPFAVRTTLANRFLPWVASALSGPFHFLLVYDAVKRTWPNEFMGLLPVAFAVPAAAALALGLRVWPADGAQRTRLLAWFGGATLFFITLIFPIQFDRQWLTLGWALEGTALLWLFHRVPHPGLRVVGACLLAVAFARLALNPAVFEYHPRSATRIFNWFLYSYGLVVLCLLGGARLLTPPRDRVLGFNAPPLLRSLAAVLAFLLLNIEIADWFSTGSNLTFDLNASFGQDMTYSIAWGLYAFLVLGVGFRTGSRAARYAGMGLLIVTIVKLFLHDLWRLGGLYRIGSLIGLAVVLMVVSFIYQRFLAAAVPPRPAADAPPPPARPGT